MSPAAPFPVATAGTDFDEASAAVVDYLKATLPMGFWAVTRYDGERQLYLEVRDDAYGLAAGGSHLWEDSLCVNMVKGEAPQIAPDAMAWQRTQQPAWPARSTSAPTSGSLSRPDGELFGTLCGLDPHKQGPELAVHAPLLQLLSVLLSTILEADLLRTEQARQLEWAELATETDPMTGLLNRRGWDRYMELEEARYHRFGDPGGVIVVDLDRLKEVNDNEGHAAGDRYIRAAGRAIQATVRAGDVTARLGGDEFGVIARNLGCDGFDLLVERILASFDAVGVSGSIGHAPYTVVAGFPGAFASADAAMYAEKARRRGVAPRRAPAPVG